MYSYDTEKQVEKYLTAQCKQKGILCFKFLSTINGVPDRILISQEGVVYFVEVKNIKSKLRPLQIYIKEQLEGHKANYKVIRTKKEVEKLISQLSGEIDG